LSLVEDLDRVFRQVHRCVRAGGHVVVSLPHPALLTADPHDPARVAQSWEARKPIGERHVHSAEGLVTAFTRTNFTVDVLLERHHGGPTPVTLLARGRRLSA
jgi:predicted SAM-dependent methyltransferase